MQHYFCSFYDSSLNIYCTSSDSSYPCYIRDTSLVLSLLPFTLPTVTDIFNVLSPKLPCHQLPPQSRLRTLLQDSLRSLNFWSTHVYIIHCVQNSTYTGCPRRKGLNFGGVFLRSNYTDITQTTYIQISMVTEILAREKCGLLWCLRNVLCP